MQTVSALLVLALAAFSSASPLLYAYPGAPNAVVRSDRIGGNFAYSINQGPAVFPYAGVPVPVTYALPEVKPVEVKAAAPVAAPVAYPAYGYSYGFPLAYPYAPLAGVPVLSAPVAAPADAPAAPAAPAAADSTDAEVVDAA